MKDQDKKKTAPKNETKPEDKRETSKGGKELGKGESKNPTTGYSEKQAQEKLEIAQRRDHLKSRR